MPGANQLALIDYCNCCHRNNYFLSIIHKEEKGKTDSEEKRRKAKKGSKQILLKERALSLFYLRTLKSAEDDLPPKKWTDS